MRQTKFINLTEGQIDGLRKLGDKYNVKVQVLLNRAVNEFLRKLGQDPGPAADKFEGDEDEVSQNPASVAGNTVRQNHSISSKAYEDRYEIGTGDSQFSRQNRPPRY